MPIDSTFDREKKLADNFSATRAAFEANLSQPQSFGSSFVQSCQDFAQAPVVTREQLVDMLFKLNEASALVTAALHRIGGR